MDFGFCRNSDATIEHADMINTTHSGKVPGISATSGAPIVADLAIMLQIPIELAVKRVETPSLVIRTRMGKVQAPVAFQPQVMMRREPTAAKRFARKRVGLSPQKLIRMPAVRLAMRSLAPLK